MAGSCSVLDAFNERLKDSPTLEELDEFVRRQSAEVIVFRNTPEEFFDDGPTLEGFEGRLDGCVDRGFKVAPKRTTEVSDKLLRCRRGVAPAPRNAWRTLTFRCAGDG